MSTIGTLLNKLKTLNSDNVIDKAFDNTATDLANVIRERMNDGKRSDGTTMPNYSQVSQKVYGYPDEPIKLKATGAFQAGIVAKRDGNVIHEDSTDSKNGMLVARYGDAIFGTGGDYKKQYLNDSYRPAFNKIIMDLTGLKFS